MKLRNLLGVLAILGAGLDFADEPNMSEGIGRTCLALAGFSEARSDGDAGMLAVMSVVLNRTTDTLHHWPQDICGVVFQPGQFLGVERWPVPRVPKQNEQTAWAHALSLADELIAGRHPLVMACDGATSFNKGGNPAGLLPACRVGSHIFYMEPRNIRFAVH